MSSSDHEQTLKKGFNDEDFTTAVDGFLSGLVGRRIDFATTTTTVTGDTQVVTFSENGTQLKVYTLVFTDGTQTVLSYVERTA